MNKIANCLAGAYVTQAHNVAGFEFWHTFRTKCDPNRICVKYAFGHPYKLELNVSFCSTNRSRFIEQKLMLSYL
jgi:hypothetical protein